MNPSSDPHGRCPVQLVAHSKVGSVSACPGCGQVHLVLEYLTLRFEADAFRELAGLLAAAQRSLERERPAGDDTAAAPRNPAVSIVH
jgi:hypothetical protein